jgi:ABC-type phosphate transport system substrate-binding protein
MMAVLIFSGQVFNWTDFGDDFATHPINKCLRHAGSGTHATLDHAVMHAPWGGTILGLGTENQQPSNQPGTYFNDGSSDMMKCINGGYTRNYDDGPQNGGPLDGANWSGEGAIGYADADQSLSSFTNTARIFYNGYRAHRVNIRNCRYDNFWSVQHLYYDPASPEYLQVAALVGQMMTFAANPNNVPQCKADYWAAYDEMKCMKFDSHDYPIWIAPPALPQLP